MCGEAGARLGLAPERVAVAETGVIGVPLPIDAVLEGIGEAAAGPLGVGREAFSEAILTTDRWPKSCPCGPAASPSPRRRRAPG